MEEIQSVQKDKSIESNKTPEQYKTELVDAVLKQNAELGNELIVEVGIDDEEKIYVFDVFPYSAGGEIQYSAGVSLKDGPVLFDTNTSNEIGKMRKDIENLDKSVVTGGKIAFSIDDLPYWERTFALAKKFAEHRVERRKAEILILPKALDFINSQQTQETAVASNTTKAPDAI